MFGLNLILETLCGPRCNTRKNNSPGDEWNLSAHSSFPTRHSASINISASVSNTTGDSFPVAKMGYDHNDLLFYVLSKSFKLLYSLSHLRVLSLFD